MSSRSSFKPSECCQHLDLGPVSGTTYQQSSSDMSTGGRQLSNEGLGSLHRGTLLWQ